MQRCKKVSAQADVVTTVTLNGNTLTSIASGVGTLTLLTDYTVSGSTITILKAYLAGEPIGMTNLTFTFSGGTNQELAITVNETNTAPTTTTGITGTARVGVQLTGTHTFNDTDVGDIEGTSIYRWLISTDGVTYTAITGATSTTYTPIAGDQGKTIKFEVTPVDNRGLSGTPVLSTATTAVLPSNGGGGSGGDLGGGGTTQPDISKVISKNGQLLLPEGRPGEVSLGEVIRIDIPANATDKQFTMTIEILLDTQSLLTNNEVLLSPVYEVLKNFTENFSKPVTLIFTFDPAILKNNQKAAIFYYDEVKKVWVELGGIASGKQISVEVNHFTKFALFAVDQVTDVPTKAPSIDTKLPIEMSDVSGHWAEASIKQAVTSRIAIGYPDGTFKPNRVVTRAEFTVMLMNALKPQADGKTLVFIDKANIRAWAQQAVAQAVQEHLITGYTDGTFRPNAEITRTEMAVMIGRALSVKVEPDSSTDLKATRAEAVTNLLRMLEQLSK